MPISPEVISYLRRNPTNQVRDEPSTPFKIYQLFYQLRESAGCYSTLVTKLDRLNTDRLTFGFDQTVKFRQINVSSTRFVFSCCYFKFIWFQNALTSK